MGRDTVFLALFGFGCLYNWITAKALQRGWTEGFLWLLVAGGSGATIAGIWYIDPDAGLLTLKAFVCSGLPMCVGAILRYVQARERAEDSIRKAEDDSS